MKIRTLSIISALLVSLVLTDCKKDFLDVKPIASSDESSFYVFKSDAEQAITTIYAQLAYMTVWDKYILIDVGSIMSDDAEGGGEDASDTPDMQRTDRLTLDANIGNVLPLSYGTLYKSIFYSNVALKKLPSIVETDTTVTQAYIDTKLGEAKFLRALNYFYLVQLYGEVPLVDHVLGSSEYGMGRSSMRSIFDLMESDLEAAVKVLPEKWDALNIGRASKGAAQGLLAKVYLFESSYAKNYPGDARFAGLKERWGDALTSAESVINGGNYKLVGTDGEKYSTWRGNVDGFRYVWTSAGDNSPETVFEIQNISDGKGWLQSRGSSLINWTCARYVFDASNKKVSSGYWGFNIPSESLRADFEVGDPRYSTTIHRAGENDSIQIAGGIWGKICYDNSYTKMYQAKYECSAAEYADVKTAWNEGNLNVKILRYADVVLIAAEAALMKGDNASALKYVNMVRTRARNCGTTGVPANLAAVTLNDIIKERRVELALEGHRFFDLVRWKLAETKLNQTLSDGTPTTYESPKNDFLPIPATEIDLSNGPLKQYDGW